MPKCPNCSAGVSEGRHYCPKCGTALTERPAAPQRRAKKSSIKTAAVVLCCALLAAVLLFAILAPRGGRYTDPDALTQEYLALFSANKPEKIEALFLPELMRVATLEELDGCYPAYGTAVEMMGIYDVTEESPLTAELVHRLIRNGYGIEPSPDDYARRLVGVIVDGTDIWFNIDMIRIDNYWYIVQVTA